MKHLFLIALAAASAAYLAMCGEPQLLPGPTTPVIELTVPSGDADPGMPILQRLYPPRIVRGV